MARPVRKKRRAPRVIKIKIPENTVISYKEVELLEKFLTDRGKLLSRRLTGVTAKVQRDITKAVKLARYLGLLPVGSTKH